MENPSKEVAEKLLFCEDPSKIESHLEDLDGSITWKPIGGKKNNHGAIHTQMSSPTACLVELLTNSFDAIMQKNYDGGTYKNQKDATKLIKDSDEVILKADGSLPTSENILNFTVCDTGTGQPLSEFEDSFLELFNSGEHKKGLSFTQGKYGMGSQAALQFSKNGYKLIISSPPNSETWAWTLTRKNGSQYEYFTVDSSDSVPHFEGKINGGKVIGSKEMGTLVKLYDYKLDCGRGRITDRGGVFWRQLERNFVEMPMNIQLTETRSRVSNSLLEGLDTSVTNNSENILEEDITITHNFEDSVLGIRDINVYLFKSDKDIKQNPEIEDRKVKRKHRYYFGNIPSVIYGINGQQHGSESKRILKSKSNLPRTAEDMIVYVDLTDLENEKLNDLFQASRDRMSDNDLKESLRKGVFDALRGSKTLQNEEVRRRNQAVSSAKSQEVDPESIDRLLEENPEIEEFLRTGETSDFESLTQPKTTKQQNTKSKTNLSNGPPTKFELQDDSPVKIPINGSKTLTFTLDTHNKYLDDEGNGELSLASGGKLEFKNKDISRERLSVRVSATPSEQDEIGDTFPTMWEIEGESLLTCKVEMEYSEKPDPDLSITPPQTDETNEKDTSDSEDSNSESEEDIVLPQKVLVSSEKWDEQPFEFDEKTVLRIEGDISNYSDLQFFINEDFIGFQNFIEKYDFKDEYIEKIKNRYINSVYLFALSHIASGELNTNNTEGERFETIHTVLDSISQVLMNRIVSEQEIEDWTIQ